MATAALWLPASAPARSRRRRPTVAVLGGGVAGLTAAHELAERGFDVTVYERRAWGGKARGMSVPNSARDGRRPLPGEHTPHVILGAYQNLPDTLRRIPFESNPDGVLGNLVPAPKLLFARTGPGAFEVDFGERAPHPADPRVKPLAALLSRLPPHEGAHVLQRLAVFMSSCDERRSGELEHLTWAEFLEADRQSEDFREIFVDFLTRELAAQDPERASARAIGGAVEAMVYNMLGRFGSGPTSQCFALPKAEAWWTPWIAHLRRLGVRLRLGHEVSGLDMREGRIAGARMRGPNGTYRLDADWYVLAVPAARARRLFSTAMRARDPQLAGLDELPLWWSNGVQLYLREATPVTRGFVAYVDSPWALISTSQAQFWGGRSFARDYGDGRAHDCVSVAISDFDAPGVLYGKPARELGPREIAREVWEQMRRHHPNGLRLPRDLVRSWHVDPALVFDRAKRRIVANEDPLLSHDTGSWAKRPAATTRIRNLFLASDYVRAAFPLTTTEAANEAARRAVNGLLDAAGSRSGRCEVFELYRPPEWEAFREADAVQHRLGRPNALDGRRLGPSELAALPLPR